MGLKNAISKFADKILAFDTTKLTRKIFENSINTFDTNLKTFIGMQLENFYKHSQNQANDNLQNQSNKREASYEGNAQIDISSNEIIVTGSKKTKSSSSDD
jgi:hypothetical protein